MAEFKLDLNTGELLIGGKRAVFHCNHYNTFLQRTLNDAMGEKMIEVQINVSERINKEMLMEILRDVDDKRKEIEEVFANLGLGILDLSQLDQGKAVVSNSHYALNCFYKFGPQGSGTCLFATGYIRAAAEILTDEPKRFIETECISMDPDKYNDCIFEVRP
ncbi:MAG: hypothetical protein D6732_13445 [Methanobacteriota archaeon]|nr:MAG: hypothetical protein D6732_13445 [Euryarchaeota archaeon]